jgi:hypothetical protein
MTKLRARIVLPLVAACLMMSAPAAAQPGVDLRTPEATVRTYWAMQEALDSVALALLGGPTESNPFAAVRRGYEQTVAGRAKEMLVGTPVRQTFAREIEAVDTAGARAFVTTRIRNTTPLAAGVTLIHEQEELREEGQQFRYLLEREGDAWRIVQIQIWSDLGDGWQDLFTDEMNVPVFARW